MPFNPETGEIIWRIHLASARETVYEAIATDTGRATFWAESTTESQGAVRFQFPNGTSWKGRVLDRRPPERFSIDYFGNRVDVRLQECGSGGTDLTLIDRGAAGDDRSETSAGWVSVLMTLKAAIDHGVDLRNHDPGRTWDDGFADN